MRYTFVWNEFVLSTMNYIYEEFTDMQLMYGQPQANGRLA